ncbi:MAG: hypothetical protein R6X12_00915 [bacterium]
MPTLRAILAWLVLPLLLALLAPELIRLLGMLRHGLLYEWLRELPGLERVELGLLALVAVALPVLRRIESRRDALAARPFLALWRGRRPGDAGTARVSHAGRDWLVTIAPATAEDEPPGLELAPADPAPADPRERRRLERLLRLAWRLHCAAVRARREAGRPGPS